MLCNSKIRTHATCPESFIRSCFFFQMLEKFAEDDRIEQMNAQKRRMKQLEHKRAVEKLIEDRRIQFQRERVRRRSLSRRFGIVEMLCCPFAFLNILFFCLQEAELEARREQERMEEYRRQIIEQERQRMLKEHASKLLGFLPKVGVSSSTCTHVFVFFSTLICLTHTRKPTRFVWNHWRRLQLDTFA